MLGFEMSPAASLRATQDSHPRADADPRLSRDGASRRRSRSARPRRPQGAPRAASPRPTASRMPTSTGRSSSTACSASRRRPCARSCASCAAPTAGTSASQFMHITEPGAEGVDPGPHRGRGEGHPLHARRAARDPQQADRDGGVREVLRGEVHRHQALRHRRRGSHGAGAGADHQAGRPARRQRDRHRHGASRAPQRARQRDGEAASRHLQRVQGRLVQARRRRGLGRREVPSRRLLRPRLRRQQRAPVADRQPLAPRDRRSGRARQGARQAGPARLHAGRAHAGAAAADPWRCGLRRPGRGGRVLRPVGPQGPPHRRLDPLHHQQPDRLHDQPALLALLALLLGRGQDGRGADLPRERRQSRKPSCTWPRSPPSSARSSRSRSSSTCSATAARPQRGRRAGVHAAADVQGDQVASDRGRDLFQAARRGRRGDGAGSRGG